MGTTAVASPTPEANTGSVTFRVTEITEPNVVNGGGRARHLKTPICWRFFLKAKMMPIFSWKPHCTTRHFKSSTWHVTSCFHSFQSMVRKTACGSINAMGIVMARLGGSMPRAALPKSSSIPSTSADQVIASSFRGLKGTARGRERREGFITWARKRDLWTKNPENEHRTTSKKMPLPVFRYLRGI